MTRPCKLQALESFRQTIDALTSEVKKAETYLDWPIGASKGEAGAGDLVLPASLG